MQKHNPDLILSRESKTIKLSTAYCDSKRNNFNCGINIKMRYYQFRRILRRQKDVYCRRGVFYVYLQKADGH